MTTTNPLQSIMITQYIANKNFLVRSFSSCGASFSLSLPTNMAELTNKVQPLEPNFTQSFGPLTNVWLPLFGVRLNAIGRSGLNCQIVTHQSIMFSFVVAIYGFVMYYIYWNGDEMLDGYVGDRRNVTINWTFQWNLLLDYSNGAIRTTGSYAAAILLFRKHWHLLENSLNETERLFPFQFQRNLYRKCHRLSLVAIAYIIVSVSIIEGFNCLAFVQISSFFHADWNHSGVRRPGND